jgi:hypothetical protein
VAIPFDQETAFRIFSEHGQNSKVGVMSELATTHPELLRKAGHRGSMSVLAQRWKGRFMFWLAYPFTVIVGGTLAAIVVALSLRTGDQNAPSRVAVADD